MADITFNNLVYRHPKTVSQLPELNPGSSKLSLQLNDYDYFLVSHGEKSRDASGEEIYKYGSRKVKATNLAVYYQDKVLEVMGDNFNFPYGEYQTAKLSSNIPTQSVYDFEKTRKLYKAFFDVAPASARTELDISCKNEIHFEKTPKIDGWVSAVSELSNASLAVNVKTAQGMFAYVSPFFIDESSMFYSREMNVENAYEDEIREAPTTESEKHNRYLFRMVGYHSVNTWKAPESGIFTCWGWVDIRSDPYAGSNCNAWIALEGYIDGKWRILQLQPFDKYNGMQLSYVSFTFPVAKGLELRLTSGFRVGTNSNKYQSANGSLANHIANCFVGGIYKADVTAQSVPKLPEPSDHSDEPTPTPTPPANIDVIDNIKVIDKTTEKTIRTDEIGNDPLATKSYVDKMSIDDITVVNRTEVGKTVKTNKTSDDPLTTKSYVDKKVADSIDDAISGLDFGLQEMDLINSENSNTLSVPLKSSNLNNGSSPWTSQSDYGIFYYTTQKDGIVLLTNMSDWSNDHVDEIDAYINLKKKTEEDDNWVLVSKMVEENIGSNLTFRTNFPVKAGTQFKFEFYTHEDAAYRIVDRTSPEEINGIGDANSSIFVAPLSSSTVLSDEEDFRTVEIPWCHDKPGVTPQCFYYTVQNSGVIMIKLFSDWGASSIHQIVNIDLYDEKTDSWKEISRSSELIDGKDNMYRIPYILRKGAKIRFQFGTWQSVSFQSDRIKIPSSSYSNSPASSVLGVLNQNDDTGKEARTATSDLVMEYFWENNDTSTVNIDSLKRGNKVLATKNQVLGLDEEIDSSGEFNLVTEIYWNHERSARTRVADAFDFHMDQIDSKKSTVAELKNTINELIAKLNALSDRGNADTEENGN